MEGGAAALARGRLSSVVEGKYGMSFLRATDERVNPSNKKADRPRLEWSFVESACAD